MTPVVDVGETTGGLEADPEGTPEFKVAFSRQRGVLSTALWFDACSTKVLRVLKGPGCSRRGPTR